MFYLQNTVILVLNIGPISVLPEYQRKGKVKGSFIQRFDREVLR